MGSTPLVVINDNVEDEDRIIKSEL
jgi:hypothetical protein